MKAQRLKKSKRDGSPVELGTALEKSLSAYVAAAAFTLAIVPCADAKIVYTPAHVDIPDDGTAVLLDVDRDGTADFSFLNETWVGDHAGEMLLGAGARNPGNAIWGRGAFSSWFFSFRGPFANALHAGFNVGPNKAYFKNSANWLMAEEVNATYQTLSNGQWLYAKRRYLGLRLMINGKAHYGWARLTVDYGREGIKATLTGYAYETIPNKPIITGKITGADVVTVEPASLGHLARGASAIPAWREKKQ
jgi:hypothetical protein